MEQPRAPTVPMDRVTGPRLTGISPDALRVVASFVWTPALLMALPRDLQRSVQSVFDKRELPGETRLMELTILDEPKRLMATYYYGGLTPGSHWIKWRRMDSNCVYVEADATIEPYASTYHNSAGSRLVRYLGYDSYAPGKPGELYYDHNYGEEAPRDWSVFAPDLEIVRGYIGFGARFDVEYPSGGGFHHEGITALHFAAVEGHLELTKLLVSAGADVNIKANPHWCVAGVHPLSFAMSRASTAIKDFRADTLRVALYLSSQGADVRSADASLESREHLINEYGDGAAGANLKEIIVGTRERLQTVAENCDMEFTDSDDDDYYFDNDAWEMKKLLEKYEEVRFDPDRRQRVLDDLDRLEALVEEAEKAADAKRAAAIARIEADFARRREAYLDS